MKKNSVINLTFLVVIAFLFGFKFEIYAQEPKEINTKSDFLDRSFPLERT